MKFQFETRISSFNFNLKFWNWAQFFTIFLLHIDGRVAFDEEAPIYNPTRTPPTLPAPALSTDPAQADICTNVETSITSTVHITDTSTDPTADICTDIETANINDKNNIESNTHDITTHNTTLNAISNTNPPIITNNNTSKNVNKNKKNKNKNEYTSNPTLYGTSIGTLAIAWRWNGSLRSGNHRSLVGGMETAIIIGSLRYVVSEMKPIKK